MPELDTLRSLGRILSPELLRSLDLFLALLPPTREPEDCTDNLGLMPPSLWESWSEDLGLRSGDLGGE